MLYSCKSNFHLARFWHWSLSKTQKARSHSCFKKPLWADDISSRQSTGFSVGGRGDFFSFASFKETGDPATTLYRRLNCKNSEDGVVGMGWKLAGSRSKTEYLLSALLDVSIEGASSNCYSCMNTKPSSDSEIGKDSSRHFAFLTDIDRYWQNKYNLCHHLTDGYLWTSGLQSLPFAPVPTPGQNPVLKISTAFVGKVFLNIYFPYTMQLIFDKHYLVPGTDITVNNRWTIMCCTGRTWNCIVVPPPPFRDCRIPTSLQCRVRSHVTEFWVC